VQQHLRPAKGAKHKRTRVGRGDSSGHGSYSGRGIKGQKSRTGGGVRISFQGGQNPLVKSLPMVRGFTNIFRREFAPVNLDRLSDIPSGSKVTPQTMVEMGLLRNLRKPVKVLGNGELKVALTVEAQRFSKSAKIKIEDAGGTVREIA